jgi:hypothetical protein
MSELSLTVYYNGAPVSLNFNDISTMDRKSIADDAAWGHLDPAPYTEVRLKEGAVTSAGVGSCFVSQTPDDILHMAMQPA